MKLRYFTFMILFLFIIGTANAIYVDEISPDFHDIRYFENDTSFSLDGFNFTIPEGFGLIENESVDISDGNYSESDRFFANEDGEIIMISTSPIIRHDLILSDYTPCDVDMNKQSINGHEGIKWKMDNATYFIYFDNDYLITLGAPDSDYFREMI
jgi:hypothetical protein